MCRSAPTPAVHFAIVELAEAREQIKTLTQYDPIKMKKNLVDNKKRLAEKTSSNEVLQKSLNKTKAENAELERRIKELQAKLAELEPAVRELDITEDSENAAEAA